MALSRADRIRMHDRLYLLADRMFKRYDPCKHDPNNTKTVGNKVLLVCANYKDHSGIPNCCIDCGYLGKNGCKVRSLGCKLGTCNLIHRDFPHLKARMNLLRLFAMRYNIPAPIRTPRRAVIIRRIR